MKYPFRGSLYSAIFLLLLTASCSFSQWASQSSGTQYPLQSIHFINSNTGFVGSQSNNTQTFVGGEIIRTTNGGMSWQQVLLDTHGRISDFHFFDSNTGFAVGGSYSMVGRIFKTTNGGVNWSNITPASITSYLWDIQFIDQVTGFASGTYGVFKTTDGGAGRATGREQ